MLILALSVTHRHTYANYITTTDTMWHTEEIILEWAGQILGGGRDQFFTEHLPIIVAFLVPWQRSKVNGKKNRKDSILPKLPLKSLKYSFYIAQPSPKSKTCKRLKGMLLLIWQCKACRHFQWKPFSRNKQIIKLSLERFGFDLDLECWQSSFLLICL